MIGDDAAERRALLAIGPIDLSPASIDLAPDRNRPVSRVLPTVA